MLSPIPSGSLQAIRLQGSGLSLKEGSVVTAKVLERLGGGRVMLSVQGKSVLADSKLPLVVGQRLQVHVQTQNGTVYLRLHGGENTPIATFLRSEGLTNDRLGQSIVQAFMRSGLPLDAGAIRATRRLFGNRGEPDQRLLRMYAIARDKGIELGPKELDELSTILAHEDGSSEEERRSLAGERERRGRRGESEEEDSETKKDVAASHASGDVLRLFNHIPGTQSHWVVLPIRFQAEDMELGGSVRLLLERSTKTLRFACWTIRSRSVELDVAWSRASTDAQLYTADPAWAERHRDDIEACLKPLGVTQTTLNRRDSEWDGFATDVQAHIIQRIDERA